MSNFSEIKNCPDIASMIILLCKKYRRNICNYKEKMNSKKSILKKIAFMLYIIVWMVIMILTYIVYFPQVLEGKRGEFILFVILNTVSLRNIVFSTKKIQQE